MKVWVGLYLRIIGCQGSPASVSDPARVKMYLAWLCNQTFGRKASDRIGQCNSAASQNLCVVEVRICGNGVNLASSETGSLSRWQQAGLVILHATS